MNEPQTVTSRRRWAGSAPVTGTPAGGGSLIRSVYRGWNEVSSGRGGGRSSLQVLAHHLHHLLGRDRLGQIAVAAGLPRALLVAAHGVGGERDDRHALGARVRLEPPGDLPAVDPGNRQ